MNWLAFLIIGLVAGWLAKAIMPGPEPGGLLATMLIGIIGAFVGGFIFNFFGYAGSGGLLYSIIVATIGAILFLWVWKMLTARRTA